MGEGQSKSQLDPNQTSNTEIDGTSTKKSGKKQHKHSRSNPDPLGKKSYTKRSESILNLKKRKDSVTSSEGTLHKVLTRKNLKKKRRSKSASGNPLSVSVNTLETSASLNDDYEIRRKQILISSKTSLNSSTVLLNRSDYLLSNPRGDEIDQRLNSARLSKRESRKRERIAQKELPPPTAKDNTIAVADEDTPVGAGYLVKPNAAKDSGTDTDDSVDWDALDKSSSEGGEEESEENSDSFSTFSDSSESSESPKKKKNKKNQLDPKIIDQICSVKQKKLVEIVKRLAKKNKTFTKDLRGILEDLEAEKIALGDSSSEEEVHEVEKPVETVENTLATIHHVPKDHARDWNQLFQDIIGQLKENGEIQEQRVRLYRELSNLALDFVHCAKTYGRIIISEAETPIESKTIPPTKIGGFAGGDKYIVNNILFKFAVDSHNLFDCEEAAIKVAGHDLKGLISYYNLGLNIHYPLMALVDYLGYRLIALSVLPISNETIVYGSADAGKHIYNTSATFSKYMSRAAKILNLKEHKVGKDIEHQVTLSSAGDIEGHFANGSYYLLDFSRTFPPCTYNPERRNSFLYCLLRPEFVKKYPRPLCPDAYSGFVTVDAEKHITEIEEATTHLLNTEIKLLAKKLDNLSNETIKQLNLKEVLHENGVNLRYMGLLRVEINNPLLRNLFLVEMIARIIKHTIRELMRNQLKKWHIPLEHSCRQTVIDHLNLIFGCHDESDQYFRTNILSKLFANFSFKLLHPDEGNKLKATLEGEDLCLLFRLVQKMTALRFTENAMKEFSSDPKVYKFKKPFHNTELEEIDVCIRHLNIVALAQGYILKMSARAKPGTENSIRLCKLAFEKFKLALQDNPNDKRVLCELADTCTILRDMEKADEYYQRAIRVDPSDASSLFKYAVFLEDSQRMDSAEDYYLRTLENNPSHDHCLQRYGHFLESQGKPDSAEEFFIRASEIRSLRSGRPITESQETPALKE